MAASTPDLLRQLHGDLQLKYRRHAAALTTYWRSFDKQQRTKCVKAGSADGVVLKHPTDPSMGQVCKFVPEWNLRDLTEPGSDFLLDLLAHRATTSLCEQYCDGPDGRPGDHELITTMMRTRNLRHVNSFKDEMTFFLDDGPKYGESFKGLVKDAFAGLRVGIEANLIVPRSVGELILQRQMMLLQLLNIIVEDILDIGSALRDRKPRPKNKKDGVETLSTKVAGLDINPRASKDLSMSDVVSFAAERSAALGDYLSLLAAEPVVLVHEANIWFFTQPGMVPDEKGRILPCHTDNYISAAVFDAVHNAIRGAAAWDYICRLLQLLGAKADDKAYKSTVLQELANVTHQEYLRAQAIFKRYIQHDAGIKCFRRDSKGTDKAGNPRVAMKKKPDEFTRSDPQLHYILRLCQPETSPAVAVDWLKKLAELHEAHPSERDKLSEQETDALSDLAAITAFIHEISPVISMPSFSRKKAQMFVSRSQGLEAELNVLRGRIDLRDFAVPLDNLLEPGMAKQVLKLLDDSVVGGTGTTMGRLYQDLVEDCLLDLDQQYHLMQQKLAAKPDVPALVASTPETQPEDRIEQRRQKEKTRPAHSSIFEIIPDHKEVESPNTDTTVAPVTATEVFPVTPTTLAVFSTLFDRSQTRGSVSWSSFAAAMAELKFSVVAKYGSVFTFFPPPGMAVQRPLTLHRPHGACIEGFRILIVARRLERTYGWGMGTFNVA